MKPILYLAGPINACSDSEAKDWRENVKLELRGRYEFLDPMSRDYRGKEAESVDSIVQGDMSDIDNSALLLANCPKPSVGTSMEIFYAKHCLQKRVVVVAPNNPSPWLVKFSDAVFSSLDQAIEYLRA